jgi:hypothetical protein
MQSGNVEAFRRMSAAVLQMRAAVDAICPPVPAPATDAELDAIDDALAEAFEPDEPITPEGRP